MNRLHRLHHSSLEDRRSEAPSSPDSRQQDRFFDVQVWNDATRQHEPVLHHLKYDNHTVPCMMQYKLPANEPDVLELGAYWHHNDFKMMDQNIKEHALCLLRGRFVDTDATENSDGYFDLEIFMQGKGEIWASQDLGLLLLTTLLTTETTYCIGGHRLVIGELPGFLHQAELKGSNMGMGPASRLYDKLGYKLEIKTMERWRWGEGIHMPLEPVRFHAVPRADARLDMISAVCAARYWICRSSAPLLRQHPHSHPLPLLATAENRARLHDQTWGGQILQAHHAMQLIEHKLARERQLQAIRQQLAFMAKPDAEKILRSPPSQPNRRLPSPSPAAEVVPRLVQVAEERYSNSAGPRWTTHMPNSMQLARPTPLGPATSHEQASRHRPDPAGQLNNAMSRLSVTPQPAERWQTAEQGLAPGLRPLLHTASSYRFEELERAQIHPRRMAGPPAPSRQIVDAEHRNLMRSPSMRRHGSGSGSRSSSIRHSRSDRGDVFGPSDMRRTASGRAYRGGVADQFLTANKAEAGGSAAFMPPRRAQQVVVHQGPPISPLHAAAASGPSSSARAAPADSSAGPPLTYITIEQDRQNKENERRRRKKGYRDERMRIEKNALKRKKEAEDLDKRLQESQRFHSGR